MIGTNRHTHSSLTASASPTIRAIYSTRLKKPKDVLLGELRTLCTVLRSDIYYQTLVDNGIECVGDLSILKPHHVEQLIPTFGHRARIERWIDQQHQRLVATAPFASSPSSFSPRSNTGNGVGSRGSLSQLQTRNSPAMRARRLQSLSVGVSPSPPRSPQVPLRSLRNTSGGTTGVGPGVRGGSIINSHSPSMGGRRVIIAGARVSKANHRPSTPHAAVGSSPFSSPYTSPFRRGRALGGKNKHNDQNMLNGVSPQGTSPSGLLRRVAVTSIEEDADANINSGGARARASGGAGMGAAVRARAGHAPSMNSTAVLPAVVASGVDRLLIHGDGDSE